MSLLKGVWENLNICPLNQQRYLTFKSRTSSGRGAQGRKVPPQGGPAGFCQPQALPESALLASFSLGPLGASSFKDRKSEVWFYSSCTQTWLHIGKHPGSLKNTDILVALLETLIHLVWSVARVCVRGFKKVPGASQMQFPPLINPISSLLWITFIISSQMGAPSVPLPLVQCVSSSSRFHYPYSC